MIQSMTFVKKFILLTCLLLISACGAKETTQQSEAIAPSILDAQELTSVQEMRNNLEFSEPEKTLAKVEELLKAEKTPALLAAQGLLQSQLGQREAAFESLTEGVQLYDSAEMYALRAFVLWRNGRARGAFRDAEYALYKDEDLPLAVMTMGLATYADAQDKADDGVVDGEILEKACDFLRTACEDGQCFGLEKFEEKGLCAQ